MLTSTIAERLLVLACPDKNENPFLRLPYTRLKLDEAEVITDQLYGVLRNAIHLDSPDPQKYLPKHRYPSTDEDSAQSPDESHAEYKDRLQRLAQFPEKDASQQARWIRCAMIARVALSFLQNEATKGKVLGGTTKEGQHYYFHPKSFYEYVWICFNQGLGVRGWTKQPPRPPSAASESDEGGWYAEKASDLEKEIIDGGTSLDDQLGGWDIADRPAPADLVFAYIQMKTDKFR